MPQSLSGAEMRKRQQAHIEGSPQALGPPRLNTCCLCWCGCCKCLWNDERRERPDQQSCTKMDSIEATEEQLPSLDEVVAWARSFELMMRSTEGRDIFREFLRSEYSEENLMFWIACEELKKETSQFAIEEKARIIYEDYVSILSPKEVSLDSRVREGINRSLAEPHHLMYEEAQLQIYTLMHRDSFPRFLNSSVYRDLLEKKRACLDT
ncbi:regulator of G-protein signaling 17 isoform X2 [Electrophorus electricus]|uniref:regulator of G-protein signaling 17 isoform X1 n=1 Tax=Electrophorus electricus TaxID=8005 RepID=UPI0015D09779|nr:regulator of G-protein signaling 17 isoform X1 [Electrophorus electricus]XP_026856318.2 regulator of G-protein signaling 17 isoform X2 [Electrophorus electricus]